MCMQRFDNAKYTRLQFLRVVSHAVGSDKMISDSQSDADDDDDTEDEDDRTQPQTAANTSDDAGTTSTMSADGRSWLLRGVFRGTAWRTLRAGAVRSSAFLRVACRRSARPKPWLSSLPHIHHNRVCTNWTYSKVNTVFLLQYSSFPVTDVCAMHFIIKVAS